MGLFFFQITIFFYFNLNFLFQITILILNSSDATVADRFTVSIPAVN